MSVASVLKRLVLVKKADSIRQTEGGIVLPDKAQANVIRGTVIETGPGEMNDVGTFISLEIKVGDEVLLPDYGGTKVKLGDQKEVYVYKESNILAKMES